MPNLSITLRGASSSVVALCILNSVAHADDDTFLRANSLVISSSTYDRSQGAVASLKVGTVLPNSATATTAAVADNNYVTVWNNESVDASFGVTSPIRLTDIDPRSGRVLRSIRVPSDQVVTSFPSKSEVGLHLRRDRDGLHLVLARCTSRRAAAATAWTPFTRCLHCRQ